MYRAFIQANESETERKLIELISSKVKPVFIKMDLNPILKIEIKFLLNYRKELFQWSNVDV